MTKYAKGNNRIEELRKKKKLSQAKVCESLGISQKTYYNYIHNNNIPSHIVIKLCLLFNCTSDYLLGLTDYTGVIVTRPNDLVLVVINNNEVIEHESCKVLFSVN